MFDPGHRRGGIVGMIPGVGGLAVYSPRLDGYGFDLHVFDADRPWSR